MEEVATGTRLTVRIDELNPVGPLKLVAPVLARVGQKTWDGRLKKHQDACRSVGAVGQVRRRGVCCRTCRSTLRSPLNADNHHRLARAVTEMFRSSRTPPPEEMLRSRSVSRGASAAVGLTG